MRPLVSVLVPAYNRERTIAATLSGILTQTYPDVEAIVVDDGSDDRTEEIARAYEGERVRVYTQPNAGPAAARNTALSHARGTVIATCDSDDILLPDHLEQALRTMAGSSFPRCAVSCNAFVVGSSGISRRRTLRHARTPSAVDQRLSVLQANWPGYLVVAPRAMFEDVNGYDPTLRSSEDWDLWLRALFAGWFIESQERPTALYAQAPNSLSHDRGTMTRTENLVVRRALTQFEAHLTPGEREYLRRRIEHGSPMDLAARADAALAAGDTRAAARLLRLASTLNPRERRLAVKAKVASVPLVGDRLLAWQASRSGSPG